MNNNNMNQNQTICTLCHQENEFVTIPNAEPGCHCHQFRPTLCYECAFAVCKCRQSDDDGDTDCEMRDGEDAMDDLIDDLEGLIDIEDAAELDYDAMNENGMNEEPVEWDMEWDQEWEPILNFAIYN
jgi:hypothetical protein